MATQVLTPTPFVPDGGGLDLTALAATPTGVTLQFANTGREMLLVTAAASAETVTVNIGALVLGETVTSFPSVTLTSGHTVAFGPFHNVDDIQGTTTVQVTLSTITSISVALVQTAGVF